MTDHVSTEEFVSYKYYKFEEVDKGSLATQHVAMWRPVDIAQLVIARTYRFISVILSA